METLIFIELHLLETHAEVFCKKDVYISFAKVAGKHQWQSLFFNKVENLFIQS